MVKILCVEDDAQLLSLYRRVLTDQGFEVLTANNGKAGKRLLKETPVDLVITDILMPDMDGLELIQLIRSQQAPPVVIAISGGGQWLSAPELLDTANRLGVRHTLLKPFSGSDLLAVVHRALTQDQG
ncbi:MAG: response regulator [Magnetococcales bacterium]|nr:response regulator [Magnetococcales bacterium]